MREDDEPANSMPEDERIARIVARGPGGTFAVAGVAAAIVVLLYFAFYFLAYLPRGAVQ